MCGSSATTACRPWRRPGHHAANASRRRRRRRCCCRARAARCSAAAYHALPRGSRRAQTTAAGGGGARTTRTALDDRRCTRQTRTWWRRRRRARSQLVVAGWLRSTAAALWLCPAFFKDRGGVGASAAVAWRARVAVMWSTPPTAPSWGLRPGCRRSHWASKIHYAYWGRPCASAIAVLGGGCGAMSDISNWRNHSRF